MTLDDVKERVAQALHGKCVRFNNPAFLDPRPWEQITGAHRDNHREDAQAALAAAQAALGAGVPYDTSLMQREIEGLMQQNADLLARLETCEREREEQIQRAFVAQQAQIDMAWKLDAAEARAQALAAALEEIATDSTDAWAMRHAKAALDAARGAA